MKEFFEKKIDDIQLHFERVFYDSSDLCYHVQFDNDGKQETFRMKRDEDGMWKILAQQLPDKIHEMGLKLNDTITDNENNI